MSRTKFLIAIILIAVPVAVLRCATGPCNNVPQRPSASPSPSPGNVGQPSPTPAPLSENPPIKGTTILVFKPTGQRQCQPGGGTNLEEVKNELTGSGVPVYEAHTQADGLMHMALCGTPTGTIHVFLISKKLKARAARLGFRELKIRQ